MAIGGLGSVERTILSNAKADAQDLFRYAQKMPLLGVTDRGANKIASRANMIKEAFSDETKEAAKMLRNNVDNINGESGMLENIAKAHNTANSLKGEDAVTRGQMSSEIGAAHRITDEKERAAALSGIASKYGIDDNKMGYIGDTISQSNDLSRKYWNAASAPFGMVKDCALDGSPLSFLAKGAVAATAAQFIGGSRTSLTEKNGQRDIAGIPFI
jgi:hypothetical protein